MPLADPEKSFDVAVRHLFRHLHDSTALQRNPLVKKCISGQDRRDSEKLAAAIRALIMHVAATCRSVEIRTGRKPQALRRYAIIAGICAGDASEKTAGELGLSIRQYYRDRRAICARVARLLVAPKSSALRFIVEEPLQLLLRRAAALVDEGFALKAVALLEDALGRIESVPSRVAVLVSKCNALIQYGNVVRASEVLEAARQLLESVRERRFDDSRLQDKIALAAVDVASASGRDAEAGLTLEKLLERLSSCPSDDELSKEVALDVFLEACSLHALNGRFSNARQILSDALTVAKTTASVRPDHCVFLKVMEAASREDGAHSVDEVILLNEEALNLSLSFSSARGASYAMRGLLRAYLLIADESQAFAWFQKGVQVARSMEGSKPFLSAAIAGTDLISTRFGKDVGLVLAEAQELAPPGTLKWAQLQGALGMHLARVDKLRDGLDRLRAAAALARSLNNTRQEANLLREQSIVLHRLGYVSDSIECIRKAVALAECGTSALSLHRTYSAAAKILA